MGTMERTVAARCAHNSVRVVLLLPFVLPALMAITSIKVNACLLVRGTSILHLQPGIVKLAAIPACSVITCSDVLVVRMN